MNGPSRTDLLAAVVADRLDRLSAAEDRKVGFPGWSMPYPEPLVPFLSYELNNYGDPEVDPVFPWHTKDLERELVRELADLFQADAVRRWGYVTTGGSEGVRYGMWLGRTMLPAAKVYHSSAAHPSVPRNAELLRMEPVEVPADARGEIEYHVLARLLARDPDPAAIVVATVGTTMTEAVDDVARIRALLAAAGKRHYLHADAALAGLPLALHADGPVGFGLHADGVDSLSFSGHKFLGAPFPCGVVLARTRPEDGAGGSADLLCGVPESGTSSRSGHAVLILWYLVKRHGIGGLRAMAASARATAEYAERRLAEAGWPAWRAHRQALTVVFPTPPPAVLADWALPSVAGQSHIVCTPGVTRRRIDEFVAAIGASRSAPPKEGSPWPALSPAA